MFRCLSGVVLLKGGGVSREGLIILEYIKPTFEGIRITQELINAEIEKLPPKERDRILEIMQELRELSGVVKH